LFAVASKYSQFPSSYLDYPKITKYTFPTFYKGLEEISYVHFLSLLISKRDLWTLKSGRESVLVRSFPLLRSRHKNPPPKGQFTFGVNINDKLSFY
jgi:hypothetical protein